MARDVRLLAELGQRNLQLEPAVAEVRRTGVRRRVHEGHAVSAVADQLDLDPTVRRALHLGIERVEASRDRAGVAVHRNERHPDIRAVAVAGRHRDYRVIRRVSERKVEGCTVAEGLRTADVLDEVRNRNVGRFGRTEQHELRRDACAGATAATTPAAATRRNERDVVEVEGPVIRIVFEVAELGHVENDREAFNSARERRQREGQLFPTRSGVDHLDATARTLRFWLEQHGYLPRRPDLHRERAAGFDLRKCIKLQRCAAERQAACSCGLHHARNLRTRVDAALVRVRDNRRERALETGIRAEAVIERVVLEIDGQLCRRAWRAILDERDVVVEERPVVRVCAGRARYAIVEDNRDANDVVCQGDTGEFIAEFFPRAAAGVAFDAPDSSRAVRTLLGFQQDRDFARRPDLDRVGLERISARKTIGRCEVQPRAAEELDRIEELLHPGDSFARVDAAHVRVIDDFGHAGREVRNRRELTDQLEVDRVAESGRQIRQWRRRRVGDRFGTVARGATRECKRRENEGQEAKFAHH